MHWDPKFADRSPMFEPLRAHAQAVRDRTEWPSRADLQPLVPALKLVAPDARAGAYEARIHNREMPVRERDWHDFFNVLAWAAYPLAKRALNAAHYEAGLDRKDRGRTRDALTLFDENGAIVVSSDPTLLDDLRAFRWKRLFVERRAEVVASMRFYVFGHALFEKALSPYAGMTAHALLFHADPALEAPDSLAGHAVRTLDTPRALAPLPVLGVPGWWPDNENPAFYDDEGYFRKGRGTTPRPH